MTGRRPSPRLRDLLALALLALAAILGVELAARHTRPLLVEFGPNDADYVRGFREDWERDGVTRFRWTSPSATVTLPFRLAGPDFKLYMRVRRHFTEPAHVRLLVEGRTVSSFDLVADTKVAYRTIEVPLPDLEGRHRFELQVQASSENPRPLGMAMDWMEIAREGRGRILLGWGLRLRLMLAVLLAFMVPRLAGASPRVAAASAAVVMSAASLGVAWDLVATERILRDGSGPYACTGLAALLLLRLRRTREALGLGSPGASGALAAIALAALALRLALLLHPQFFYPDVKIHALFARALARQGLATFLSEFTANQLRYSLGLQLEGGHWYAFPYPPVFYMLSAPLVALAGLRPETAVSTVACAANALETLIAFGIARRLLLGAGAALAAAGAHALLPIFLARLTLAYFPAVVGHAVDALVVLYLLSHLDDTQRPRVIAALSALIAAALLTYTQAVLNLALLLPLYVAVAWALGRGAQRYRRLLGLAAAGALGALLSLAVFYGRYVPVFLDMRRGVPMPQESIVLERLARLKAADPGAASAKPADDPYTGPNLDIARGVRKAGWRLWIFYGPFASAVALGIALLIKRSASTLRHFVIAWAATYVCLNLASGGLPGPNLVRYNKDLEVIAPLCCAALAIVGQWLWQQARMLGAIYGLGYVLFASARAIEYLTSKFVLER